MLRVGISDSVRQTSEQRLAPAGLPPRITPPAAAQAVYPERFARHADLPSNRRHELEHRENAGNAGGEPGHRDQCPDSELELGHM